MPESPYLAEKIRRALTLEPTIGAPELDVEAVGDHLVVTGRVPTRERRDAIEAFLARRFPGSPIDNRVVVAGYAGEGLTG